ncbi:hypothetical protein F6Q01_24705, partial [Pectobacterium parmentieri]|nr:hypothetical protein [Pectobacterium parmentieri]
SIRSALGKIDLNQSASSISKQVSDIQNIARGGLRNGIPIRPLDMDKAGGALGNSKVNALWNNVFGKGGW